MVRYFIGNNQLFSTKNLKEYKYQKSIKWPITRSIGEQQTELKELVVNSVLIKYPYQNIQK